MFACHVCRLTCPEGVQSAPRCGEILDDPSWRSWDATEVLSTPTRDAEQETTSVTRRTSSISVVERCEHGTVYKSSRRLHVTLSEKKALVKGENYSSNLDRISTVSEECRKCSIDVYTSRQTNFDCGVDEKLPRCLHPGGPSRRSQVPADVSPTHK